MDVLSPDSDINLFDPGWRIYARNPTAPPHFVSDSAVIEQSLVTEGCQIYGTVENSVLFHSGVVEEGAQVRQSIIMPGAIIGRGAEVEYSIIAEGAVIKSGAYVGGPQKNGESMEISVVAEKITVGAGQTLAPGKMADKDLPEVRS
jgi:glucose-1-phosphate adenylyltransferase